MSTPRRAPALLLPLALLATATAGLANPIATEVLFTVRADEVAGVATVTFLGMRGVDDGQLVLLAYDAPPRAPGDWEPRPEVPPLEGGWTVAPGVERANGGSGLMEYHRFTRVVALGDAPRQLALGSVSGGWRWDGRRFVPRNANDPPGGKPSVYTTTREVTLPARRAPRSSSLAPARGAAGVALGLAGLALLLTGGRRRAQVSPPDAV